MIGVAVEDQQAVMVMALLWVMGDVCRSGTTVEGGDCDDMAATVIVLVVAVCAVVRMVVLSYSSDG